MLTDSDRFADEVRKAMLAIDFNSPTNSATVGEYFPSPDQAESARTAFRDRDQQKNQGLASSLRVTGSSADDAAKATVEIETNGDIQQDATATATASSSPRFSFHDIYTSDNVNIADGPGFTGFAEYSGASRGTSPSIAVGAEASSSVISRHGSSSHVDRNGHSYYGGNSSGAEGHNSDSKVDLDGDVSASPCPPAISKQLEYTYTVDQKVTLRWYPIKLGASSLVLWPGVVRKTNTSLSLFIPEQTNVGDVLKLTLSDGSVEEISFQPGHTFKIRKNKLQIPGNIKPGKLIVWSGVRDIGERWYDVELEGCLHVMRVRGSDIRLRIASDSVPRQLVMPPPGLSEYGNSADSSGGGFFSSSNSLRDPPPRRTFRNKSDYYIYVKMVHMSLAGVEKDILIHPAGGGVSETSTGTLVPGKYKVYIANGKVWYGLDLLFGPCGTSKIDEHKCKVLQVANDNGNRDDDDSHTFKNMDLKTDCAREECKTPETASILCIIDEGIALIF